jgi:hypothetical protein
MADFFDRLVARGARLDLAGPASAAAEAGRQAGMVMARPRLPGPFERPAPQVAEQLLEADAGPAPPGAWSPPPPAAAPAPAPQRRTHAELVRLPVAHRGAERDREPLPPPSGPPAPLVPAGPQLPRPPAAEPAAAPAPRDGARPAGARRGPGLRAGPGLPLPVLPAVAAEPGQGPRMAPAQARRSRGAAHADAAAGHQPRATPPGGPTVRISIGRIEVRASGPAEQGGTQKRAAAARPAPVLSLDRFLAGDGGGR